AVSVPRITTRGNRLSVYIVTWNVGSAMPPDDISGLFGPRLGDGSVDMFIVG
uniref:Uncharacterized protein n=1 Tax=Astyanax mexicanus TaxID=7994 RepID=A0A8B9JQH4_ASTMX